MDTAPDSGELLGVVMEWMVWSVQLVVAVAAGFVTVRLIRRLNHVEYDALAREVADGARHWPWRASWLSPFVPLTFSLVRRFIRPSPKLKLELRLAGAPATFTDREFLVMTWTLICCSVLLAAGVLLVFTLLSAEGPSLKWWAVAFGLAILASALPWLRLHDSAQRQRLDVQRGFPAFLDGLALTLESGLNFQSALQLAVQRLPQVGSGLQAQLHDVLRDIRAGQGKVGALQRFAERLQLPEISQFVASIIASERQGVSITGLLRRQAEQLRISRALAAERHAMKLPVKLLAPLAICIFPCTFLVLAFPIGVRLSQSGLFA